MKLVGVGTYEVVEDEQGRPTVRISGHLLKTGQVFEKVLDSSSDIVKAVSHATSLTADRAPLAKTFE